jgi:hypothetical protein
MKKIALMTLCAFGLSLASPGVFAQTADPAAAPTAAPAPDCAARAAEKKLAGAALNSFMKKCQRDAAAASCTVAATEKKLAGAARASFTRKCVKDATAAPAAQ